jgi:hypothetical protein
MLLPSLGDDAQAVAVAVEGQAQLGARFLQLGDQVRRFSGLLGSGWWLGKLPSTSLNSSITSQPMARKMAGRRGAGDAVARIDHDLQRAAPA